MGDENTTRKSDDVACSFCNETFPSLMIRDHFVICGNKTDQCPNCQKYIRRAIFAYHYENNCANLEESIKPPENAAGVVANHNGHGSNSGLPTTALTRMISGSRRSELEIMTCMFCNEECEVTERIIHEANCVKNPMNIEKRRSLNADRMTTDGTDQRGYEDNSTVSDLIPCEVCAESFPPSCVVEHTKWCLDKVQQQQLANRQHTDDQMPNPPDGTCRHCFQKYSKYHFKLHEKICDYNPSPFGIMHHLKKDLTKSYSLQKGRSN